MQLSIKTILSAALFVAFAGTAIFGAYAMVHNQGHSFACIGTFENSNCATAVIPFEHLECYLSAIQRLSLAAFQPFPFISLLLAIFALALFLGMRPEDISDPHRPISIRDFLERSFAPRAPMLRWLSLHEKRDPSIVYAMN